jgi:hypothetical protein
MHFNTFGRFAAGGRRWGVNAPRPQGMMPGSATCYWYITPQCLDYLLRTLRFEVLDVVYFYTADADNGKPPEARVAVTCRATAEPHADPGDEWMTASHRHQRRFNEYLSWPRVRSQAPEVGYSLGRDGLVRGETGRIDVHASIEATEPLPVDKDHGRLALGAVY